MVSKTDKPTKPFSIIRDGMQNYWSAPYDTEYREALPTNTEARDQLGLACIGHHVVNSQFTYCPSFKVTFSKNLAEPADQAGLPPADDYTVVLNKANGRLVYLAHAYSEMEAVVSWFARSPTHDGFVLCYDRAAHEFYVDAVNPDLLVGLDANDKEVPLDEAVSQQYRLDMHENAVMLYGE